MSKPANNTLIGAFVVGALMLVVAAVMVLGSGKLFTKTEKFVLYFDGSVKGLDKGAPVVFQGVKIGSVTDIYMVADPVTLTTWIPVIIQIDTQGIKLTSGKPRLQEDIKLLIRRGLRAKMDIQSPVTAKLMIQLGMYPNSPVRLVDTSEDMKGGLPDLPQIPTLPATFQLVLQAFQDLNLKELAKKFNGIMDGLDVIISSAEFKQLPLLLKNVLAGADSLIGTVNEEVKPLAGGAREAIKDYRALAVTANNQIGALTADIDKTLSYVNSLVKGLGNKADKLEPGVRKALTTLQAVLERLKSFSGNLKAVTSPDSTTAYDLQTTLREVSNAARSVRVLTDYLTRNPDALLRGRRRPLEGK
jgi:paraquat-inducible protein B